MIQVYSQNINDIWFALACNEQKIVASSFADNEQKALNNLLNILPFNEAFEVSNSPSTYAKDTFALMANILKGKDAEISNIASTVDPKLANPLDIALESIINLQCEEISCKRYGFNNEKIMINDAIMSQALNYVKNAFSNDKDGLIKLHDRWLQRLTLFLVNLTKANKKTSTDDAIYLVSEHFRISTLSAIRAIASLQKNKAVISS